MQTHTSDNLTTEWHCRFLPLWIGFLWVSIGPFVSLYRVGPLSSFYLEAGSLFGVMVLILLTAQRGLLNVRLPAAAIAFLVLAAYWWLQARILHLIYPGMNDMVVWTFIVLALTAWAVRGWISEYGQEPVVNIFAWALLFGTLIQAAISFIQFKGWANAELFRGIIAYSNGQNINGQLGQRNHLGHYLMWGILCAAYLWSMRKMPNTVGCLLMIMLTAVLGLVNSRTILTYLVGVGILLPFWRLLAGRMANRLLLIMFFTLMCVALFQFSMGPLLEWLGSTPYETAVERAANSGFEGSLRQIEWHKAWLAFQSAPWLGHGWNSYGLQSFLINAEQHQFTNNILGVLFTHSHNIVMQLLAETGLIGTLLVAGCLLFAIQRLFRRPHSPASFLLLALMTVSMCHSMLEYPLWYIYFLVVFGLMTAMTPARYTDRSDSLQSTPYRNYLGGAFALCLIIGLQYLTWSYTQLVQYSSQEKTDSPREVERKIQGLQDIAAHQPMLRYYAELSLARRADPTAPTLQPWAEQAALNALTYRPYANAYQVGLYLYRKGDVQAATDWMQAMYYYYPYTMSFYESKIRANERFRPLLPKLLADCHRFRQDPKHQTAKPCTPLQTIKDHKL